MKYLIWVIILGILGGAFFIYKGGWTKSEYKKGAVIIEGNKFEVEIADNTLQRTKGLSGREQIGPDEGMLFVFGSPLPRTFWMKDMLMPIDILWINDGKIVGIENNALPELGVSSIKLKQYQSPQPVKYVLEIAAGRANELGIQIGDEVDIRFK